MDDECGAAALCDRSHGAAALALFMCDSSCGGWSSSKPEMQ